MKKHLYAFVIICLFGFNQLYAAVGDTTWVQGFNGQFTHFGAYDTAVNFPDGSVTYRKVYMIITIGEYNCPQGSQYCHQWDYDVENYVMTPGGDTLELSRFITPYATAGTPGFSATWKQHYIFDITDYYPILKGPANSRIFYSGYSWGFTGDVKYAFIEGTPERNVVGHAALWNAGYTYGNPSDPIDDHVQPFTLTPPAGTQSAEMKFAITGHGYDNTSGCCEFDNTGVGHAYTVLANDNAVAQHNMNINCGQSELYPQGGTWLYGRAGNWCPGGLVDVGQYLLTGVTAETPYTTDVNFNDSYDGGGSYGSYKIASSVFYYAGYNKVLDASLEDIIAPTDFEWYRRENPQVSIPMVKVRNTGGTPITTLLIEYGVKDSTLTQYLWTGSLAPSADTVITLPALPALTRLSLGLATGSHAFVASILQVNGQTDNDASNNELTSQFKIAPRWPYTVLIKLKTSSIGADGNFGTNPADASWQITDENNNIVAQRTNANSSTQYYDTVTLHAGGFYALSVSTTQCYGLNWWALAGQTGYTGGSFAVVNYLSGNAVLSLNGTSNSGQFMDDFGCGFVQYFTTQGQCIAATPVITQSGDTLTATAGTAFLWYNNGNPITGATAQTYIPVSGSGNYTVQVTDYNQCTGNSASFLFLNTGTHDLSAFANAFSVFPVPAHDVINIAVSAELTGTTYALYDITGRRITAGTLEQELTPVSLNGIASGVYLVSLSNGLNNITKKIVIQK